MGFSLVACPMLVLVLGAADGVFVVNLCASVSSAIVLFRLWREVEWRNYRDLTLAALVGIVPGAWLAVNLAGPWLEIAVGTLLVAALLTSLLITRSTFTLAGTPPALVAGFVSGAMNAAAGVGGPAVSAYAVLSKWNQTGFAATLQPYFLTIGLSSMAAKLVLAPEQAPEIDWWIWLAMIVVLVVGIGVGDRLAPYVSARVARAGVLVISFGGAVVAIVNGAVKLG
jgi:uncharacterized protein